MLKRVSMLSHSRHTGGPSMICNYIPRFNFIMFSLSDRGKVVGGLPDVVTIMEKKVC